jgi:hypothetical protein
MPGRARPGQGGRLDLMPAGDDLAQLLHQSLGLGRHLAAQTGDGRERERVDVRILPAAQQARHDIQLRPGQSPVGGEFSLEPLNADSRPRKQDHPIGIARARKETGKARTRHHCSASEPYATRSGKARVTAAVRLETWSLS